jgi:hypothetical protein
MLPLKLNISFSRFAWRVAGARLESAVRALQLVGFRQAS